MGENKTTRFRMINDRLRVKEENIEKLSPLKRQRQLISVKPFMRYQWTDLAFLIVINAK